MIFWPVTHPLLKGFDADSYKDGGVADDHALTISHNPNIYGSVSVLSIASCPLAILRTVITIIVNSIKGKADRGFPHISYEVFKLEPSFADRDASTTVPMIVGISWGQTSRFHVGPNAIGWRNSASPCAAVRQRPALHGGMPAGIRAVFPCSLFDVARKRFKVFAAMLAGALNSHVFTFSPGGSREGCSEIGRLFPDFSAAKPIRAPVFYHA